MKKHGRVNMAGVAAWIFILIAVNFGAAGAAEENFFSLEFDGENYVALPEADEMLGEEPEGISVSLWAKFSDFSETVYLAGGHYGRPFAVTVSRGGNRLNTRIRASDADDEYVSESIRVSGVNLAKDRWYHICFSYSYETGKADVFLDGQQYATDNFGLVKPRFAYSNPLRIGRTGSYESLKHVQGEFRIYTRALDRNEVSRLYNSEPVDETNLAGLWKLDEGEGDTLHDSSGNGRHGKLGPEDNKPVWRKSSRGG